MKRLIRKIRHQFRSVRRYRPRRMNDLADEYDVRAATQRDLMQAKRLHASVYLDNNYISRDQVKGGILTKKHDPYQGHSRYFVVVAKTSTTSHTKGEVVAVARQIEPLNQSTDSLPVFMHAKISNRHALHQSQAYVEVSALVKKRGIDSNVLLLLFKAMLRHSEQQQHKIWFMAIDERAYWRFKALFPYTMQKIGRRTYYMGSYVIPAKVSLKYLRRNLALAHMLSIPPFRQLRKDLREMMS